MTSLRTIQNYNFVWTTPTSFSQSDWNLSEVFIALRGIAPDPDNCTSCKNADTREYEPTQTGTQVNTYKTHLKPAIVSTFITKADNTFGVYTWICTTDMIMTSLRWNDSPSFCHSNNTISAPFASCLRSSRPFRSPSTRDPSYNRILSPDEVLYVFPLKCILFFFYYCHYANCAHVSLLSFISKRGNVLIGPKNRRRTRAQPPWLTMCGLCCVVSLFERLIKCDIFGGVFILRRCLIVKIANRLWANAFSMGTHGPLLLQNTYPDSRSRYIHSWWFI